MAGIYIHIPFCRRACTYCNFFFSVSLKQKSNLIDALIKEIELRKNYLEGEFISSIYFGGGTPSLMDASVIRRILDVIENNFTVVKDAEITLEANPDDLTGSKLHDFAEALINRLSIGVQSFSDADGRRLRGTMGQESNDGDPRRRQRGNSNHFPEETAGRTKRRAASVPL